MTSDQMSANLLKDVQAMEGQGPKVDLAAIGAQHEQLAKQTGLAGLAEQSEAMRKQYADMQKTQASDRLTAGLLAGGRYGSGGYGYGSLQAQGQQRNADLAFADKMYSKDAARVEKSYDTQAGMLKEAQKRADDWAAERRKEGIAIRADDIKARRDLEMELMKQEQAMRVAKLNSQTQLGVAGMYSSARGASGGSGGGYDRERMEQLKQMAASIKTELSDKGLQFSNPQRYKELMDLQRLVQAELAAGIGLPVQSGTAPAGGAQVLRFDAKGNRIQ
jgi:hypothetical protein